MPPPPSILSPSLLLLNYPWKLASVGATEWEVQDSTPVGVSGLCLTEKVTLWSIPGATRLLAVMHNAQNTDYIFFSILFAMIFLRLGKLQPFTALP